MKLPLCPVVSDEQTANEIIIKASMIATGSDFETEEILGFAIQQALGDPAFNPTISTRYAVCGETIHDPYCNYTILGEIIEIDLREFESRHDAMLEARDRAVTSMPESPDELVNDRLLVLELTSTEFYV